jgi:hypothetical protein
LNIFGLKDRKCCLRISKSTIERMRLRGLSGARDEFHLAAIAQKLESHIWRPLPSPAAPVRDFINSIDQGQKSPFDPLVRAGSIDGSAIA